jgi:hypothetical protein
MCVLTMLPNDNIHTQSVQDIHNFMGCGLLYDTVSKYYCTA